MGGAGHKAGDGAPRKEQALPGDNIMRRHFNTTAKKVRYGDNAEPLIQDFIARTPAIVDKVRAELPAGFSEKVADRILDGI